jgi:hypothetical protein
MNYRGGAYDAEEQNPYAIDDQGEGAPFRRGRYGSFMSSDFRPQMAPPEPRKVDQGAGQWGTSGDDQGDVKPMLQGFRLSQDGQDAMSASSDGLARGMGQLANSALQGKSNYISAVQEQQSILRQARMRQEHEQQQAQAQAQAQSKKGGGLLGAIGGIAGSLIGGPIGGIIGGVASLFG